MVSVLQYILEFQICGISSVRCLRMESIKGRFEVGSPPTQLTFFAPWE